MQTQETTTQPTGSSTLSFGLSESAAARINHLKAKEGKPSLKFRISVQGGGCSGFQYEFKLDESEPGPQDLVFNKDGAEVIIDDLSLSMLSGSTLDYTEDLSHAGFSIKNPKATMSCGCGNSFSV